MARSDNFQKFIVQKKGSAVKEALKQEKKLEKKERRIAIEKHFEEKRIKKAMTRQFNNADRLGKMNAISMPAKPSLSSEVDTKMPLNKYIAHSGLCGRREAAEMIKLGMVLVNEVPITEPGYKVLPTDSVFVKGKNRTIAKNWVYILLNKPKDYVTTVNDERGRKTVLDLVKTATQQRIYPIGRLDRNSSGVLLLTNDGELTQKLSHPSYQIKKVYEVRLDKPLSLSDFDKIQAGITLEDGFIKPDALAYVNEQDKSILGIEIHSGKNRIVRRMFESLKYDVKNLDRVLYAGLTKKNVERGHWRFLTEREITILKHMNNAKSSRTNG